jgi:serine protease Do
MIAKRYAVGCGRPVFVDATRFMATGLVIHISSGEDKHTEILTDERIRIGPGEDCDLRLRTSDLRRPPESSGPVLELGRVNGSYRVTNFDRLIEITHNGKTVETKTEIRDGDEVRIRPGDLALQFFPIRSLPAVVPAAQAEAHVAPFIEQAAIESAATARRDDAKVFLREFTRELVREINTTTKLIALAIALALVGGVLYIGFGLFREIQTSRRVADSQRAQLSQMKDQVDKTNKQLTELVSSNNKIQASLSLAPKLRTDFGSGVCLIAGSFYYVESGTGRALRYPEAQTTESGAAVQSGTEQPALTAEGKGPVAEFEFVGSGFYVGQGYVVTNRHIAQPWLADEHAQSLNSVVRGQPRLKKLMAYFPDHPQPFTLKFKQAAQRDDLSVCNLDVKELPTDIPILPLESDPDAVTVGKMVLMMGYPSGPDRLLALLDDNESRGIQQRYGTLDSLLGYLAETKRIQPLTTQGNITSLDVRRIAYDARTAEGGSGSPLFGPTGRVIGVNFAVFTENQASNFAVPIRYAVTLLAHSGWQTVTEKESPAETLGVGSSPHPNSTPSK